MRHSTHRSRAKAAFRQGLKDNGIIIGQNATIEFRSAEKLFKLTYGLDVVQVPFQGGGPAVTSTLAGHTQILHITLPLVAAHMNEYKAHINERKLRGRRIKRYVGVD
jgi:tripartite-type tricarboxylate transporter receptor subunit TctC